MDISNAPKWHQRLAITFIVFIVLCLSNTLIGIGGILVLLGYPALAFLGYQLAQAIGENKVLWGVLCLVPLVSFFAVPVLLTKSMNKAKALGASANLINIRVA